VTVPDGQAARPGVGSGDAMGAADAERLRSPVAATAGVLTLVYVVWYAVDLIVLGIDPALFNRVHRVSGGFVGRTAFAVIGLAVLFHATDGLGRAVIDLWPSLARHRVAMRAAGRFVTMAVGFPGVALVLWPAVRAWWVA
jgi:succinate dehydrogenase/fumarate reductase cytochrome b subunit